MSEATNPNATTSGSSYRWIGQSMKRVEDPRLLTGRGRYIDDVVLPDMAHAAVLRSPHAHARIKSIDTSRAEALPGVVLVMTGTQAAEQTGPLPCFANPPVAQYCIATDRVRHVGEAVAAVVAESRYVAEDAIDLIDVEYELLPAVVDPEDAITSSGDAVLHPERGPSNIALQRTLTFGPVEDDFAAADRVIRRKMRWPRSGGQPMETVGAVAAYDEGMGKFTIHTNISMYNYVGWLIAVSLNVPAHRLNIVPVIAGGSFGSKLFAHKVPVLAATLARAAGQPVQVPRGSYRQHYELRQPRVGPGLRHGSRGDERRHDYQPADEGDRRLRRLSAVRGGPPRQCSGPAHGPVPHRKRGDRPDCGADEQVPAGRLSRVRVRGHQLRARTHGRCRRRRTGNGSGGNPAQELHPARPVPVQDPDRQRLRQR